ncbi:unnamed protein product [Parnassius apollo]|uniref:(apollo) hypothetical protein n=1 Tax=Parnassius apollo TaxID=110799 RepID=A0A8S3WAB1_PARAO|nr:unnamed protein product [Parnassius apollo]
MPRKSFKIKPGVRKYGTKSNYTPEFWKRHLVKFGQRGEEGDGNELKSQNIGGHAKFVVKAMIHRPPSPEIAEDLYMLDIGDNLSVLQEQEVEPPVITIRGDFTIGVSEEQIL